MMNAINDLIFLVKIHMKKKRPPFAESFGFNRETLSRTGHAFRTFKILYRNSTLFSIKNL